MRVGSFKVSNFRSIGSAEVELADLTCLVGPNNEGKSNLLRALGLGLSTILGNSIRRTGMRNLSRMYRPGRYDVISYDPHLDRPIGKDARALTTITIRFELTQEECDDFHRLVGHSLNGELPAQVQFTTRGAPSIQFKKQRVGSQLTAKGELIGRFIDERLGFQYVPPIRTAEDAALVINSLVRERLMELAADEAFARAAAVIDDQIATALQGVEKDLQEVLPRFLSNVTKVTLAGGARQASLASEFDIRSIVVDDGTSTELAAKGSGVQSLAAIALLRHGAQARGLRAKRNILALEEPEAHLHSGALHQLRPLLAEIAEEQQLIFSTHSGVLVPTSASASTVIVRNNEARTSKSLAALRDALGVRLADNLQSARLVLIVEGGQDVTFWEYMLGRPNARMSRPFQDGVLVVEKSIGAGNISYHLQTLRRAACDVFVVYDADVEGRSNINRALKDGELLEADYLLSVTSSNPNAQLEDLLDGEWVADFLRSYYKVDVHLSDEPAPWSDRLKAALTSAGKTNSKASVEQLKSELWVRFGADPESAISQRAIDFATRVEDQLASRPSLGMDP